MPLYPIENSTFNIQPMQEEIKKLKKELEIETERANYYRDQWQKLSQMKQKLVTLLLDTEEGRRDDGRREVSFDLSALQAGYPLWHAQWVS